MRPLVQQNDETCSGRLCDTAVENISKPGGPITDRDARILMSSMKRSAVVMPKRKARKSIFTDR